MLNTIKKSFLGGIVFLGTVLSGFIGFAAWTNLTADIPNQETGDIMTKDIWNNIVSKLNKTIDNVNYLSDKSVPTGAIMAFNGTTCPTGWTIADGSGDEKNTSGVNTSLDLRGEFIRGLDSGRGIDIGRILKTNQLDALQNMTGSFRAIHLANISTTGVFGTLSTGSDGAQGNTWSANPYSGYMTFDASKIARTATETRPRNVALLYCVKL